MTQDWLTEAETICLRCGGHCCEEAHPPISEYCYRRLVAAGVPEEVFERDGYRSIRTRDDGTCICCTGGKCRIHAIKPETCRAGPFSSQSRGSPALEFLRLCSAQKANGERNDAG